MTLAKAKQLAKSEFSLFVIARILVVLVKPLLLWICIREGLPDEANEIASWYLINGSLMVIFNNEAHFQYYKNRFADNILKVTVLREEVKYYKLVVVHALIFLIPVFALIYLYTNLYKLALLFLIMVIQEKVFDEIQRFLQFQKKFKDWSIIMLIKSIIPFLATLIAIYFFANKEEVPQVFFITNLLSLLVVFYIYTSKKQWKIVREAVWLISKATLVAYINVYLKKLVYNQLQSISGRNVPLLDRTLIKFFESTILAPMTIAAQMGSFGVLIVDYFLISHRRKEYIEKNKDVFSIISKRVLIFFGSLSLLVYVVGVLGFIKFGSFNTELGITADALVLVGVYYTLFAISQHFTQYDFWNRARKYTLSIDSLFYLLTIALLFIIPIESFVYRMIFSLIIAHIVRITLLIVLATRKHKKYFYV